MRSSVARQTEKQYRHVMQLAPRVQVCYMICHSTASVLRLVIRLFVTLLQCVIKFERIDLFFFLETEVTLATAKYIVLLRQPWLRVAL